MKILELIDQLNDIFIRCGNLDVVEDEYGNPIVSTEMINDKVYIQS